MHTEHQESKPKELSRIEYWPTSQGIHIVSIDNYSVRLIGVLWI